MSFIKKYKAKIVCTIITITILAVSFFCQAPESQKTDSNRVDIVVEDINEDTSGHPYISIKSDNYSVVVYFN